MSPCVVAGGSGEVITSCTLFLGARENLHFERVCFAMVESFDFSILGIGVKT